MSTKPAGPAIQKGIEFLRSALDTLPDAPSIHRLPSISLLAKSAGISRNSMWRAAQSIRDEGRITFVRGGRIVRTVNGKALQGDETRREEYWERVRSSLARDIANNRFAGLESLPTCRELQAMYRVNYATLRKCLESLEAIHVLERNKRTFIIPASKQKRFGSTIVVFSLSSQLNMFDVMIERSHALIDAIEKECARLGLIARIIGLDLGDSEQSESVIRSQYGDDAIIGYIFDLWWLGSADWQQRTARLLSLLAAHQKPFALLDHASGFPGESLVPARHVRFFYPDNFNGGASITRLLIQHGHRHIGFLSIWHQQVWARQRYAGAYGVVKTLGPHGSITLFSDTIPFEDEAAVLGILDFTEKEFERIFKPGTTAASYRMLLDHFHKRDHPADDISKLRKEAASQISDLRALALLPSGKMRPGAFAAVRHLLFRSLGYTLSDVHLNRLLAEVAQSRNITAWICASDDTAIKTQRFLGRLMPKAQDTPAVAGFDNKIQAREQKITSYDFNIGIMGQRMVGFVLNPEKWSNKDKEAVSIVEGTLIVRESTRPVN